MKVPFYQVALGTLVALAVAGGLILVSWRGSHSQSISTPSGVPVRGMEKGWPDAKVTIIEYADFQCPWCGLFARTTQRQIEEDYMKTGKVKIIYRNFAFLGQESILAAEAAECASEQNLFWPYHDKLFENQAGENKGAFSRDKLRQLAAEVGLDTSSFDSCFDSPSTLQEVVDAREEGRRLGVRSTPSFLVNGRLLVGAQPFEAFKAVIERDLLGPDGTATPR